MASAQTRIATRLGEAQAACRSFGVLLSLEFHESVHRFRGRAFHDDVDAAAEFSTKYTSMAAQKLLDLMLCDSIGKLCTGVSEEKRTYGNIEKLTLHILTTPY